MRKQAALLLYDGEALMKGFGILKPFCKRV